MKKLLLTPLENKDELERVWFEGAYTKEDGEYWVKFCDENKGDNWTTLHFSKKHDALNYFKENNIKVTFGRAFEGVLK